MLPCRVAVEWVARNVETDILGQFYRQLVTRYRQDAAKFAMDDRNGRAPITLAANAPVAQAILCLPLAPTLLLGFGDDGGLGLVDAHAVHPVRIHDPSGAGVSNIAVEFAVGDIAFRHHAADWQLVLAGKIKVALVMRRAAENGAGAIIHQHEIGDIDRQVPTGIERMFDRQIGIEAHFFGGFEFGCGRPAAFALGDEILQRRGIFGERLRQRMVGRNRDKACAIQRIRTRGEHIDSIMSARQVKGQLQPFGLADPVFLHQPHLVGPFVEAFQTLEQFLGKIGDLQKPLVQLLAFNERA